MLGAAGGVAGATLALLTDHPLGRALIGPGSEVLLVDRVAPEHRPPIPEGLRLRLGERLRWLPPTAIDSAADLDTLLGAHPVDEVIELAVVGTADCIEVCAAHGASYLGTAYDAWPRDKAREVEPVPSMVRSREMFAPPDVDAGTHLLCMGMNPGLINVLVGEAIQRLAARAERPPSLAGLDLYAILLTERDSCRSERDQPDPSERFACTWSPQSCLEELLERHAWITVDGELVRLDHRPHEARYTARCGDDDVAGNLVPHEELVTLGAMYPTVELAYVYELCPAARASLRAHPQRDQHAWPTARLYPPYSTDLVGDNELGVLLCSRSLGELWLGWRNQIDEALALGTNAVLLQVAAGVVAGWHALRDSPAGVYLPEELDRGPVLAAAESILGPLREVWAPDAPVRPLAQRLLPSTAT